MRVDGPARPMERADGTPRAPAMTDVARLAGVSHQTVSRVINGHQSVRPATRARVLGAVEHLGYRLNPVARALVTGRTHTLGIVGLQSRFYGPMSTVDALERAARLAGYSVRLASVDVGHRADVRGAVRQLLDQAVDGVAVIAPLISSDDPATEIPAHLPAVIVDGGRRTDRATVTVDHHAGAVAATEHLLAGGHPTVWHVAGPHEWVEARVRTASWRPTMHSHDVDGPPPLNGDWTARSGYQAGCALARIRAVSAVFAANDQMALGVLAALAEHGLAVPEDVSVVGFDDIPESAYLRPALTTVRQDFAEVGRCAVRRLVDQLESDGGPGDQIAVQPRLIIRRSTASPACSDEADFLATRVG